MSVVTAVVIVVVAIIAAPFVFVMLAVAVSALWEQLFGNWTSKGKVNGGKLWRVEYRYWSYLSWITADGVYTKRRYAVREAKKKRVGERLGERGPMVRVVKHKA